MEQTCPVCGNWTHDGWVATKERVPAEGEIVLAITPSGIRCFDSFADGEWGCKVFDSFEPPSTLMDERYRYTHWMHVPDLPESEDS